MGSARAQLSSAGARRGERGAAIVEFALVLPILVTILLFSMYLTELARVKLKVQEASRYVAWELTSYTLTDFANQEHERAWEEARTRTIEEATERFRDLDSAEPAARSGVFEFGDLEIEIENQPVPMLQDQVPGLGGGFDIPGSSQVIGAFDRSLTALTRRWGFNHHGQIQATVRMNVTNTFLGREFLQRDSNGGLFNVDQWGGRDLSNMTLSNRFTLVANAWNLADGGDVTIRGDLKSTGKRDSDTGSSTDHGMFRQVKKMSFLGLRDVASSVPGFDTVRRWMPVNPLNVYVVSHNYDHSADDDRDPENCGLDKRLEGQSGLVNQGVRGFNILGADGDNRDISTQRCFDTAPFRDTHEYASSHYREIFRARGEWFMGCPNPQADDPTRTAQYTGDKHDEKQVCADP